jgi:hypothetical protein
MISRGWDSETIRSRVLTLAKGVIRDLAADGYQAETHVAIAQRTVDDLLERLMEAPSERPEDTCPAK